MIETDPRSLEAAALDDAAGPGRAEPPGPDLPLHPGGDLGWRIRLRRRALGLTRQQLAARAGISEEFLGFLEDHPAEPHANAVVALARALRTTREELRGAPTAGSSGGVDAHPDR